MTKAELEAELREARALLIDAADRLWVHASDRSFAGSIKEWLTTPPKGGRR